MPKLHVTPGGTRGPGPDLGEHTEQVLGGLAGVTAVELASLRRDGVV